MSTDTVTVTVGVAVQVLLLASSGKGLECCETLYNAERPHSKLAVLMSQEALTYHSWDTCSDVVHTRQLFNFYFHAGCEFNQVGNSLVTALLLSF